MREKYIELMERTLSAYSNSHIQRYFDEVRRDGLSEHGFPRLTANIGILIAHGRRIDLMPIFLEMMEFCCASIPRVLAANDFSVREIISAIRELESAGVVPMEHIERWREYLRSIVPEKCYNKYAKAPEDKVKNWALFTGVSEFFRHSAGLSHSEEFIETQLASQLKWIDENGMYMDGKEDVHHPIAYDLAPRGLFVLLLNEGYRGAHYEVIDDILRRSALLTLKMQSPNGEVAFGGRSNQFLHNEPWLMMIYEYEVKRYAREGNDELVRKFRAASLRALGVTEYWLSLDPIYHIKNRFSTETKHGCEEYAYFDKYMITVASMLHGAYLVCDDSIPELCEPDETPAVFETTEHFHKIFLKAGGYGVEFDTNGDPHYDASGLGRVHKVGAPSAICMSLPCPSEPNYRISIKNSEPLSFCPAVMHNGEWIFATGADTSYELLSLSTDENAAYANISCHFFNNQTVSAKYKVNEDGVKIEVSGDGDIAYMLPAFCFDGTDYTEISSSDNGVYVTYKGWRCSIETDGKIVETDTTSQNRSGYYKKFFAAAEKTLTVNIKITKIN